MFPLIDTHCHFAESSLASDDILQARKRGLVQALVCATHSGDFEDVQRTACKLQFGYALGSGREVELHVEYVRQPDPDGGVLGEAVACMPHGLLQSVDDDVREDVLLALVYVVEASVEDSDLVEDLAGGGLLVQHVLPLLKHSAVTGVLHAFAGSYEQARQALAMGFKLGFGPSLTYPGSKRIREVFARLPEDAFVLETDAPFLAPVKAPSS